MSALEQSLAAHRAELVAFVERRVGDRAFAEDLVHATFEHALSRLESLRDEDKVLPWLYRSLRNAIVDRSRRRAAEVRAIDALAAEIDDRLDVLDAPARVCRCVLRVSEGLKPEYTEALARIDVDGTAVKAFAEDRGISSSNAAVRVFRAREALRRGLISTCGACAESKCIDCTCGESPAP